MVVIVPCRDEAEGAESLCEALADWARAESEQREVDFVFVDDGSTDGTGDVLRGAVAASPCAALARSHIVRHETGRGLTAALATGLAVVDPGAGAGRARACYIGWLDADQTYDVRLLGRLAAELDAGADVACVSPYHPDGGVEGVPAWRLAISRGASIAWRIVSRGPRIHTYTSMVRVWRREVLIRSMPENGGFLGVTESLVRAVRSGARVAEVPAVLRTRRTGQSKMRVARVMVGHLRMMLACLLGRFDRPALGAGPSE